MTRWNRFDTALLVVLLGLFLLVLVLHLREAERTGLQQPAIFATNGPGPYPVVGGVRLERGGSLGELELGDRLLRVGPYDLDGVGYPGFEARALAAAGSASSAELLVERDGRRFSTRVEMKRAALPWYRIPFMVTFVAMAVLMLRRIPDRTDARIAFGGVASFAIFETPVYGPEFWQYALHSTLFHGLGPVAIGLILAALTRIPPEVPEEKRLSRWIGAVGVLFVIVRIPYFTGGPISPDWVPRLVQLSDVSFLLTAIGIVWWNTLHATAIGRRRVKWVALGLLLGGTPIALTMLFQARFGDPEQFAVAFQYASLAAILAPAGFVVAIVRENLYDVDRLWSSAATYSLALVALLATGVAIVVPGARAVAGATGIHFDLSLAIATIALAAVVVPLGRQLQPWVDRVFFPERVALDRGIQRLLTDLSDCHDPDETFELLRERLGALFRAEPCRVAWRAGDESPAAASPLLSVLASDPVPHARRSVVRRFADFGDAAIDALATPSAEVLVPVRLGKDLAGVISLGPKRSGDLYPATELAWLGAVAEKASAELVRLAAAAEAAGERDRAEELRRLKDDAEEANRAKSRFLAAASHDLRQPLHALGLFVERLAGETRRGELAPGLVEQIGRSTGALTQQFDALLDLSRLDAGGVVPHPEPVALADELSRIADEFQPAAARKGLVLRCDVERWTVDSDRALLNRIVQNLVANAVRYTEAGHVALRCNRDGDAACVEVSDTGPGIPPESRAEVFREFVQLDGDGAGEEGLGLGLSIVRRSADLLGLRLELDEPPGGGARFRLWVPGVRPTTAAGGDTLPLGGGEPFLGRRVLLVEDEVAVLDALSGLLRSWGCEVISAERADAALAELDGGDPPELVIADYQLSSDATGLDVIDHVRGAAGLPVPAVVVSAESSPESLARIRESGLPYLAKPVRPAKLRALLAELFRRERTLH